MYVQYNRDSEEIKLHKAANQKNAAKRELAKLCHLALVKIDGPSPRSFTTRRNSSDSSQRTVPN